MNDAAVMLHSDVPEMRQISLSCGGGDVAMQDYRERGDNSDTSALTTRRCGALVATPPVRTAVVSSSTRRPLGPGAAFICSPTGIGVVEISHARIIRVQIDDGAL